VKKVAGYWLLVAGSDATSNKQQATSNKQQATSNKIHYRLITTYHARF
jgi:hypothetical protein